VDIEDYLNTAAPVDIVDFLLALVAAFEEASPLGPTKNPSNSAASSTSTATPPKPYATSPSSKRSSTPSMVLRGSDRPKSRNPIVTAGSKRVLG
jgi:hypothetical protein